eukprot:1160229-Pelagomonas_calceolata.AAC.7
MAAPSAGAFSWSEQRLCCPPQAAATVPPLDATVRCQPVSLKPASPSPLPLSASAQRPARMRPSVLSCALLGQQLCLPWLQPSLAGCPAP